MQYLFWQVAGLPGTALWVMEFEVSKEFRHGEVLQARRIICHAVGRFVDVGDLFAVSVVLLV